MRLWGQSIEYPAEKIWNLFTFMGTVQANTNDFLGSVPITIKALVLHTQTHPGNSLPNYGCCESSSQWACLFLLAMNRDPSLVELDVELIAGDRSRSDKDFFNKGINPLQHL
ncbi:hypothetical protein AMTR_s00167p00058050 [Amborella trichopoda]|uniref:Uncharacterized protein n=1 Tax=Amborella trichopoda TaxID=13333 RepID=W1PUB8_AMBTC|nr:hypothetical protein AMTR_s00167p00058050 [Amborella trichopoda]